MLSGFIDNVWAKKPKERTISIPNLGSKKINRYFRRKDRKDKVRILRVAWMQASENPKKLIMLDEIEGNNRRGDSLRLRYHIVGKKGRMKGKWAFGQFATIIMPQDLRKLLSLAKKHGMI